MHPLWITTSACSGTIQNLEDYVLSSGPSPWHCHFLFLSGKSRPLEGLNILHFERAPDWNAILMAGGASILDSSESSLHRVIAAIKSSRGESAIDYVMVDPLAYSEEMLSALQFQFVKLCLEINETVSSRSGGRNSSRCPAIVTTDWVAYCIQSGELHDPSRSDIFTLPRDPVRRPTVYKEKDGDKYVLHDLVFYQCSHSSPSVRLAEDLRDGLSRASTSPSQPLSLSGRDANRLSVGIVELFTRKNVSAPVSVRIRPLSICKMCLDGSKNLTDCEALSDNTTKKYLTDKLLTKFVRTIEECSCFFLSSAEESSDVIVSTSQLQGRAVVLPCNMVNKLSYLSLDPIIFCSSRKWEVQVQRQLQASESGSKSNGTSEGYYHVQQSQDY